MHVDDLAELFDVDLDEDEVDTVGGLIGKTIGRVPILGSTCEVAGLRLTAERMSGRRHRIATVVVEPASSRRLSAPEIGGAGRMSEHEQGSTSRASRASSAGRTPGSRR